MPRVVQEGGEAEVAIERGGIVIDGVHDDLETNRSGSLPHPMEGIAQEPGPEPASLGATVHCEPGEQDSRHGVATPAGAKRDSHLVELQPVDQRRVIPDDARTGAVHRQRVPLTAGIGDAFLGGRSAIYTSSAKPAVSRVDEGAAALEEGDPALRRNHHGEAHFARCRCSECVG